MSFEIRRDEKWDRVLGICINTGRSESDHSFNKTKYKSVSTKEVPSNISLNTARVYTEKIRIRISLCRVKDKHLVSCDPVPVRRNGPVGLFGVEVINFARSRSVATRKVETSSVPPVSYACHGSQSCPSASQCTHRMDWRAVQPPIAAAASSRMESTA